MTILTSTLIQQDPTVGTRGIDKFYSAWHDKSSGTTVFHWGRNGTNGQLQRVSDPNGDKYNAKLNTKRRDGYDVKVQPHELNSFPLHVLDFLEDSTGTPVPTTALPVALKTELGQVDALVLSLTTSRPTASHGTQYAALTTQARDVRSALEDLEGRLQAAMSLMSR